MLAWRIEYCRNNTTDLEILSNPATRTHLIYWPDNPHDPVRPIEYLHELAHAVLSEQELFLAGGVFDLSIPDWQHTLIPAVRAADDWWADYLLDVWCPEEARAEIHYHLELMQRALQGKGVPPEEFFGIAEILAEGAYYLDANIRLPDNLQPAIAAFLAHPPDKPSRQATEEIIQALFDVAKLPYRIIFQTGDNPRWSLQPK